MNVLKTFTILLLLAFSQAVSAQQATFLPPPTVAPSSTTAATADAVTAIPPTRQPTPDIVVRRETEFVYPTAIRFSFVLSESADAFGAATLRLSQEGWQGEERILDLAENATRTAPQTEFSYVWDIPTTDGPRLFRELAYTWRFILNNGDEAVISGQLDLRDPRADWMIEESPAVTIASPGPVAPRVLVAPLTQVAALMQAQTGRDVSLSVVLYSARLPLDPCFPLEGAQVVPSLTDETLYLPCSTETVRALYAQSGYVPIEVPVLNDTSALEAITAAMFDRAYDSDAMPAWFRYGMALFYAPTTKPGDLQTVQDASRAGRLLTSLDVVPEDTEVFQLWQAQSYGLVLYMLEQIGQDALFELAIAVEDGTPVETAYEALSGSSFRSLTPGWSAWIFGRAAEAAYGYNPYQTVVAEFAQEPTRTRIPRLPSTTPSHTPTATPTITYTPLPTITGIKSPTLTNTYTPSATFTATATPRPAGSLILTATPIPVPDETSGGDVNVGVMIIAVGLMLMLLLLGSYGIEAMRRR